MQIYSADQTHQWDSFTISEQNISSVVLMERAATTCYNWLMNGGYRGKSFTIYCGKGNNGGDGLVVARLLASSGHIVAVYIPEFGHKGTEDFQLNLARLHDTSANISFIPGIEQLRPVRKDDIIIDALFGSGLNRAPSGLNADVINHINNAGCEVISIDIPSGMSADHSSKDYTRVRAKHTLTFGQYKLAQMMAENEGDCGHVHLLDIGLSKNFDATIQTGLAITDEAEARQLYKPRSRFSHKGTYGHALIIAGSFGKIGAAVLATRACLRSGAGLTSAYIPFCGYNILQQTAPEAMAMTDKNETQLTTVPANAATFAAIGIGPGIGTAPETANMLTHLLEVYHEPLVIDADAGNILGAQPQLLVSVPPGSVFTPHPKEFETMFGKTSNDFERMELAISKAKELNVVIVLKGHRTLIAGPNQSMFNSTGNPGMATGGSGDVLTGLITGLLAQKYEPFDAAVLGVYLHGAAGDAASASLGFEAMNASDIIEHFGNAFLKVSR